MRAALGLETLGVIGAIDDPERLIPVATDPRTPVSEAYRVLRTNIRYAALDAPLRTILVTSPGPTEGKSVTVANLAATMAEAGLKVVTVDADLRRPRQHHLFELEREPGLTDALLAGRLDGQVRPTMYVGQLGVLPAGELPPNPAEVLGSARMGELLARLAEKADVVIVDSPPSLPVTDAAVLARQVDAVLLVLDAGKTRR
ncbi:MAG TPA: CpsD/CapB family tyrosine-protein kinase [Armatimonadota bacterium]|nr:CpsD/CapB family tyrosine-protein kinase [Armatimonadota bacterium]